MEPGRSDLIIPNKLKYYNYTYEYLAKNDPELRIFVPWIEHANLSKQVLQSIQIMTHDDRNQNLKKLKIIAPRKDFKQIDTDCTQAMIMPNVSSSYSSVTDGVVKHVEIKLGDIVPKPIQRSVIDYLKNNYDEEQWEKVNWLKGLTIFEAKQTNTLMSGKAKSRCGFHPPDMLNPDKVVSKAALWELFKNFPSYAKMYSAGELCQVTDGELDFIIDSINQGALQVKQKYESLSNDDLDEVAQLYQEVLVQDEKPSESIENYFKTFFDIKIEDLERDSIEYKWKKVMDLVVAQSFWSASIMVKWIQRTDSSNPNRELLSISFLDTDTRSCENLPKLAEKYRA